MSREYNGMLILVEKTTCLGETVTVRKIQLSSSKNPIGIVNGCNNFILKCLSSIERLNRQTFYREISYEWSFPAVYRMIQ